MTHESSDITQKNILITALTAIEPLCFLPLEPFCLLRKGQL